MYFSVIVPVHNAEDYLEECLNSIFDQNFLDFEVILVVNASVDKSQSICETWASAKPCIKLVVTDVPGVSHARNLGIQVATGDWYVFVDSDDLLQKHALATLCEGIKKQAKFVVANYDSGEKTSNCSGRRRFVSADNYKLALLDRAKYFEKIDSGLTWNPIVLDSVWAKAYNANLISEKHILFPENVKVGEDLLFNLDYSAHVEFVYCIDESVYYYRVTEQSASRESSNTSVLNRLDYLEVLRKKEVPDNLAEAKSFKYVDIILRSIIAGTKYIYLEKTSRMAIVQKLNDFEMFYAISICRKENISNGRFRNWCYCVLLKLLKRKMFKCAFFVGFLYNHMMNLK